MQFDPLSDEYQENPYKVFQWFRENDPVNWGVSHDQTTNGSWYLFSYDDVSNGLRNQNLIHERQRLLVGSCVERTPAMQPAFFRLASNFLVSKDPPAHTRLRSLVSAAFTPRMVEQLAPYAEQVAHSLIDAFPDEDQFDLVSSFSGPLPIAVIGEMLGVPVEDYPRFSQWSQALSATIERSDKQTLMSACAASDEMTGYLSTIISARRKSPRNDLISNLIQAEADGSRLSEDEMMATCMLLLVAGHETTANLIANGMLALLQNPGQLALLIEQPALTDNAIEELLRYDSPAVIAVRWAAETLTISGRTVKAGDRVALVVGAANHDPQIFENPDKLDITRAAGRHLSFGGGIHYCLGAPLARMEARVAFRALLTRLPDLRLTDAPVVWQRRPSLRALKQLLVHSGKPVKAR